MNARRMFPALTLLIFLGALTGCSYAPRAAAPVAPPVAAATSPSTFRSPSGKSYTRTLVAPPDSDEPTALRPQGGGSPAGDDYQGTARMAAKLSIASGPPTPYTDLGDVLDSLIPDDQMRAMNISAAADSGRLDSEQAQITVTAFLYASSHESDNDFHCIVGRDPSLPARFINVEVSGLPASDADSFSALSAARDQFKAFFTASGTALPARGYEKFDPPIPIQVTGSLFFDVDHVPPAVGPVGMKPQTAWELHPVTVIQFEP